MHDAYNIKKKNCQIFHFFNIAVPYNSRTCKMPTVVFGAGKSNFFVKNFKFVL